MVCVCVAKIKTDTLSAAHYIKLIALKSLTMSEVKHLVSDSREQDTFSAQRNEKYFDCYLYGAKYYCTQGRANKSSVVFDFCQESGALPKGRTKISTAGSDDKKMNDLADLGGPGKMVQSSSVITTNNDRKHVASKVKAGGKKLDKGIIYNLRRIPHRDGFISIEGDNDCNGFYVNGESKEQQNQLKHCFLRLYEKNKRIKLIQDCDRLRWPKLTFSHKKSSKIYNSIPFFVILIEFLFDNMDVDMKEQTLHHNYMSLMESIHCLLLFKNYHKTENRKRDNKRHNNIDNSGAEFGQCNLLLSKKLMKLENEKREYWLTWPEVCCTGVVLWCKIFVVFVSAFFFFLF